MTGTLELEDLVKAELRPYVASLVEELIPQLVAEHINSTNGNGHVETRSTMPPRAAEKPQDRTPAPIPTRTVGNVTCRLCGQEKPPDAFDQGRRTCRVCRHQQHRARQARAAAVEEEHTAASPPTSSTPAS